MIEAILVTLLDQLLSALLWATDSVDRLQSKLLGSAKSEVSSLSATAKLEEVKAKTEVVKAAVDARTDVINDVHTAVEDLAKKL